MAGDVEGLQRLFASRESSPFLHVSTTMFFGAPH